MHVTVTITPLGSHGERLRERCRGSTLSNNVPKEELWWVGAGLIVGRPREPNVRGRNRAKQEEVLDGEKASIKAHEKSGEGAEEYTTCTQDRSSFCPDPSCHQNF